MNLPPVHGYGVPTILNQWNKSQDRRERKQRFDDTMDFNQAGRDQTQENWAKNFEETQTANQEQKNHNQQMRLIKIGTDYNTKLTGVTKLLAAGQYQSAAHLYSTMNDMMYKATGNEKYKNLTLTNPNPSEVEKQTMNTHLGVMDDILEKVLAGDTKAQAQFIGLAGTYKGMKGSNQGIMDSHDSIIEKFKIQTPGSMTDQQKSDAQDKRVGYKPQTKEAALELKTAGKSDSNNIPTPTDIDDYVERFVEQYKLDNNGEIPPPKLKNKAALEFKRAQAKEVSANRFASRNADAATAETIKYNEGIGSALAEIATAADLLDAKGEVTPQAKITGAKGRMSGNLAKLANHYVTLNSTGAMLNVDNETIDNVFAAVRSSSIGQAFGRITGTNEQSIRSAIKKLKPLLIQDIRQSTDMGARGLDSEKELEFYLQAATDEKTDIQSNIAAIVVLDEAFGEGKVSEQLRAMTDESLIRRISQDGAVILSGNKSNQPAKQEEQLPTATNPQTGETLVLKNGEWVKQ